MFSRVYFTRENGEQRGNLYVPWGYLRLQNNMAYEMETLFLGLPPYWMTKWKQTLKLVCSLRFTL